MSSQTAILIAASLATLGWVVTARRSRMLSRKQHTINTMLQAQFNREFRETRNRLAEHLKMNDAVFDLSVLDNELKADFRFFLNHYEFIAAGIRSGDFDERIVWDCERGSVVRLFEVCELGIFKLRDSRARQSIFEHLEWLYKRWEKKPPGRLQRVWEGFWERPVQGRRIDPHE